MHIPEVTKQVQIMAGNASGEGHVITDPHGCFDVLDQVMAKKVQENDRLFICGDLIDRGPDSLGVIEYISKINSQTPGKIYAIRGNHEDEALTVLAVAKKFWQFIDQLRVYSGQDDCMLALKQCVKDLKVVSFHELQEPLIGIINKAKKDSQAYAPILEANADYMRVAKDAAWIFYLTLNQIDQVSQFIIALPYTIHVEAVNQGNKKIPAFEIAHAAPLSVLEMEKALIKRDL